MYDFTARVNIHGQRKIANPEVTVIFDCPKVHEVISLGWHEVSGERPLMAAVLRGSDNDAEELTVTLSRGSMVTERYIPTLKYTYNRIIHPQLLPLPTSFPKIFPHHTQTTNLTVFSSLSSNPTTIASRLKTTGDNARRLATMEERDDLVNQICEITSYFEEEDDWE